MMSWPCQYAAYVVVRLKASPSEVTSVMILVTHTQPAARLAGRLIRTRARSSGKQGRLPVTGDPSSVVQIYVKKIGNK